MTLSQVTRTILMQDPFYGFVLMTLSKSMGNKSKTACVYLNGINQVLEVNPDFWNTLTDLEQVAVIKHELLHICFFHLLLADDFDNRQLFNIACDLEVNSYLQNLPEGAFTPDKFGFDPKLGCKKYYELLQSNSQISLQAGSGNDGLVDDHSLWDVFDDIGSNKEAVKSLIKNQIDSALKEATEAIERASGNIPGELSEYIKKLMKKKPRIFDWKSYLRRSLGNSEEYSIKFTHRRPSKRFKGAAGPQHERHSKVLVAVDTSGSVNSHELADFFTEITYIKNSGTSVDVLECDTNITRVYPFTKWDGNAEGRGGTDYSPIFEYFNNHYKEYSTCVIFTDGYCGIPEIKTYKPIIWIITSNGCKQNYPGKTIYIPKQIDN